MIDDSHRHLHYAAAIGCGVFASLSVHIGLTVLNMGIDAALHDASPTNAQMVTAALAWWATAAAGFLGGWAAGHYLIAARRGADFVYRIARAVLIAIVVVAATVAGVLSKSGPSGGTAEVVASLTAFGLGLICAFCGARLAYLNAEQV